MESKGVLEKIANKYSKRIIHTALFLTVTLILILLLILFNRKKKITAMYWCGISAMVAGIIGTVPNRNKKQTISHGHYAYPHRYKNTD